MALLEVGRYKLYAAQNSKLSHARGSIMKIVQPHQTKTWSRFSFSSPSAKTDFLEEWRILPKMETVSADSGSDDEGKETEALWTFIHGNNDTIFFLLLESLFLVMLKAWRWYQKCLAVHPVKTKVISSGVIWGFGDVAAQSITHYTAKNEHHQFQDEDIELKLNWKRVAPTSFFGFGFVGPVDHFWYEGLDSFIRSVLVLKPNSFRFVAAKVAIDGFLFGPVDLLLFFAFMGLSTGKIVPQIKEDVKRDFLPALILEGSIWPPIQVANFRFVPVRCQLLYVNSFCLLDSCFLSWIEQQQDAAWKQWFRSILPFND